MNNILFPTNSKFIKDVGNLINSKKNKIYFFGHPKNSKNLNEFYNSEDIIEKIFYKVNKKKSQYKFKINDRKKFKFYQNIFNNFSKRIYIKKNLHKKENLFLEMCNYHYDFIKKNNISHVVYWATPHFHFGISLFYISEILGLKQYILHETDIENTFIVRKNWFSLHRYLINKNHTKVLSKYLSKNQNSRKSKIIRSLRYNDLYDKNFFLLNFLYFVIKKIARILFIKNNNDKDGYFIYLKNHPRFLEAYLRTKMLFTKLIRNYFYNYFISEKKVNLDIKYVYFALHVEPERTVSPEGGIFHDQIRAIKLLRKSIPNNIKIYIKEHPNEFWLRDACIDTLYFKGLKFYKQLKNIKNVTLLSNNINPDLLIKNSICTATITGTSGWEGIKMQKKTIAFGFPWYADHKNCLCISKDDKNSINKINNFIFKRKIKDKTYTKNYIKNYNQYLVEAETWENVVKTPKNIDHIKKLFASKLVKLF